MRKRKETAYGQGITARLERRQTDGFLLSVSDHPSDVQTSRDFLDLGHQAPGSSRNVGLIPAWLAKERRPSGWKRRTAVWWRPFPLHQRAGLRIVTARWKDLKTRRETKRTKDKNSRLFPFKRNPVGKEMAVLSFSSFPSVSFVPFHKDLAGRIGNNSHGQTSYLMNGHAISLGVYWRNGMSIRYRLSWRIISRPPGIL